MKFYCTDCRKNPGGRYQIACPECCGWRQYPFEPKVKMPLRANGTPVLERNEKGQFLCARTAEAPTVPAGAAR